MKLHDHHCHPSLLAGNIIDGHQFTSINDIENAIDATNLHENKNELISITNLHESNFANKKFPSPIYLKSKYTHLNFIFIRKCFHMAITRSNKILTDQSLWTFLNYHRNLWIKTNPLTFCQRILDFQSQLQKKEIYGFTEMIPDPEALKCYYKLKTQKKLNLAFDFFTSLETSNNYKSKSKFRGIKLFADGSLGAGTARTSFNYPNKQHTTENSHFDLQCIHASKCKEIAVHAIGDRAIADTLDLYKSLPQPRPKLRIEHCQILTETLIKQMANLNVTACIQPLFSQIDPEWVHHLPAPYLYHPFKLMKDAGIKLIGGSDFPISPIEKWALTPPFLNST